MLTIDTEFKSLIPPLAAEELAQLEENIVRDGIRDPLVTWNGILLDGHNRHEIAERRGIQFKTVGIELADRNAAMMWIIRNQFGRRNLALFTRGELALKLEEMIATEAKKRQQASGGDKKSEKAKSVTKNSSGPIKSREANLNESGETRQKVAKIAGMSHDTIAKVKAISKHADEATKAKLRNNEASIHRVAKDIKEKQQRDQRQEKRQEAAKAAPALDERIIVGDFREHVAKVADGSLSLIFTDPPYDREASKMLPALAEFAAAKLAEGGSMLCYVGQTQLPAAMDAFRKHLRYWWTVACIHAGRKTVMREYGINCGWKAVLWFVKGTRDNNSVMVSDTMSGGEEKSHHDWQQAQSEAEYWIEKLCPKDGIVCDPFLGGGTTSAAAKAIGREWIGFEVNEDQARIAGARLAS